MLKYFAIGCAAGAITGVPIGPVNIAVIDTAYRHHLRRAIAVALGGAVADMLYALLGILWFGPFVKTHPGFKPYLYAFSGIVLVIYGLVTLRSKAADPARPSADHNANQPYFWSGFGLGMALILLNPSTLLAWVAIFGSWMAGVDKTYGAVAAVGIGVGSFVWFSVVAFLAHRGKSFLQEKSLVINRCIGAFLIFFGLYSFWKSAQYWVA